MSRTTSIAISVGLIGSGALAWTIAARPLVGNPDLAAPLNPLGINRSPYGEVFAMAMQSPIDIYFHAGMGEHHDHGPGETCNDPSHDHEHDANCQHHEDCEHDHDEHAAEVASVTKAKSPSTNFRFSNLLNNLDKVREIRTNPKSSSEALKLYLRRQAEDKLRFAYELDPSHYANYNSLHFFLTEPQIGTRPGLTPSAAKLAEDTIQYCLKQDHDPRPALTAAAAASNVLDLMFKDRHSPNPKFSTAQMRQLLSLLDHCLARYHAIAKQWDDTNQWELMSAMRIQECKERLHFINKVREAADKTIIRLEQESQHQASN
jgi:hypothetical protein